jgi:hypothetical protein
VQGAAKVGRDWITADTAYDAADNLVWLTLKRKILPFSRLRKQRPSDEIAEKKESAEALAPLG